MAWSDPKLWMTVVGVLVSLFALWKVEARNKNERHQELLDRADEWLKKLVRCRGTAKTLSDTIERIRSANPGVGDDFVALEFDRYLKGFEQYWDWTGPTLPSGPITVALRDVCHEVVQLNKELKSFVTSDRLMIATKKIELAYALIERGRGKW